MKFKTQLVSEPGKVHSRQGLLLIGQLEALCFPGDDQPSHSDLGKGWWWLFLDEGGDHVGYCAFRHWWGKRGFMNRAGVAPKARGHGLQRRMIRLRERRARAMGYERMLTYTAVHNVVSGNNLIAAGYKLWWAAGDQGGFLRWYKDLQ